MPKLSAAQQAIKTRADSIQRKQKTRKTTTAKKKTGDPKQQEKRAKYEPGKGKKWENKVRPDPETRKYNKNKPICGATRSKHYADDPENPGVCCLGRGWGTEHLGYGRCKFHGGNTPGGLVEAEREVAAEIIMEREITYGVPRIIGPHEALLEEIHRTAGHVAWLQHIIGEMSRNELTVESIVGLSPSVWLGMYNRERDHLVTVCKAAVSAGVQERQVQLEEDKGRLIAMVIRDILWDKDLQLSPEQKYLAGEVVRKHLLSLDAGQRAQDEAAVARLRAGDPLEVTAREA